MTKLLLQKVNSWEVRTALSVAMLKDDYKVYRASFDDLATLASDMLDCVPVGSVEFVREYARVCGVALPNPETYPEVLKQYLGREITTTTAKVVLESKVPVFVKPKTVKQFTGFVFEPGAIGDAFYQEQVDGLKSLSESDLVYTCGIESFVSEYRFYIDDGEVLFFERYDDSESEDAAYSEWIVKEAAAKVGICALDFGVTEDGRTLFVESNDFWALGYYGSDHNILYVETLVKRWNQLKGLL